MSQDNFYTFQELKDFTNNFTDLTILNISKFIETKTNKEYAIVKRKMIVDLHEQFFKNNFVAFDIQRFLSEIWEDYAKDKTKKDISSKVENFLTFEWAEVVERNHLILGRWKDELKDFDFQGGK